MRFRSTETGPGLPERKPWEARLATLAHANRTTIAEVAESPGARVAAGQLRWDADALLVIIEVMPVLNLVLIDDVLRVYPHQYVFDARCVAKRSAGNRCRNTLSASQPRPWNVWELLGEDAVYVQGFDLDGSDYSWARTEPPKRSKSVFSSRCAFCTVIRPRS